MEFSNRFLNLVEKQLSSFQAEEKLQHLVVYIAKASDNEAPTLEAIGEWPITGQALPPVESDPDLRAPSSVRRWYPLQEGELLLGVLRAECLPSLASWPESLDRRLQATAFVLTNCISLEFERTKLLDELSQQRHQMSLMVHQLRNPLSALRTYAELLLRRLGPENRNRKLVEGLLTEQAQLDRYISGLDLIGTLNQQTREDSQAPLMLPPLSSQEDLTFKGLLAPLVDRAAVTASLQSRKWLGPSRWPEWTSELCSIDNGLVVEIVANLLENAFRYSPSGISVGLSLDEDGLCVWDTGTEIPQDERAKIFDKGFRGKATKSKPGSGIGLALGRELAEKIGASLELVIPPSKCDSSLPSKGNAFRVRLSLGTKQR